MMMKIDEIPEDPMDTQLHTPFAVLDAPLEMERGVEGLRL
jgi:hypothetical protein